MYADRSALLILEVGRTRCKDRGAGIDAPKPVFPDHIPMIDEANAVACGLCRAEPLLVVAVRIAGQFGAAIDRSPDFRLFIREESNGRIDICPFTNAHVTSIREISLERARVIEERRRVNVLKPDLNIPSVALFEHDFHAAQTINRTADA